MRAWLQLTARIVPDMNLRVTQNWHFFLSYSRICQHRIQLILHNQLIPVSNTSMLEAPKMLGSDKRFVSNLNNCKTQLICWVNHHNDALNLTSNGRCLQLKTSPVHVEQEFSAALSVDSCWFLCRWGSCHSSAPKDSYIGFVQTWGW